MGVGGTGDLCRLPRLDQRDQGASSGARQPERPGKGQRAVRGEPASGGSDLAPDRALALLQGHWEIENRLFYVKDDGFGEDRQVLQHHHSGLVMSLLRGAGLTLLRGNCPLWSDREPLTGRAQRLAAHPSATFAPSHNRL